MIHAIALLLQQHRKRQDEAAAAKAMDGGRKPLYGSLLMDKAPPAPLPARKNFHRYVLVSELFASAIRIVSLIFLPVKRNIKCLC